MIVRPLSDDPIGAIECAGTHAPYLKRLQDLYGDLLASHGATGLFETALADCADLGGEKDAERITKVLRQAKGKAHLSIAALDLSGASPLLDTTARITRLADTALQAALDAGADTLGLSTRGLFVAALGKMGAFELNYSSDIDIAAFFDPDIFDGGPRGAVDAASRIVRASTAFLDRRTADGYVFRTDLRLRPDPGSTPVAVSTRRAETYYESVGQNWERMVWIKGRVAAGDADVGKAFLDMLEPFVWRRHLDYWAIADVHAIKNMINAKVGANDVNGVAPDLKLGPGGIREIEFFAQTQQIILGGRSPSVRSPGTLSALQALHDIGVVDQTTLSTLHGAYTTLRHIEHRIQMVADEQTHSLPAAEAERAKVANLCGHSDLDSFDAELQALRETVHGVYNQLFSDASAPGTASRIDGNLVFTGVDSDPGTVQTLTKLGFQDPESVIQSVRRWHHGRTPATRTERGRELLTIMLPDILSEMSDTGEPDQAFLRFGRFLEGLRSGVETLSMLKAEPHLLSDLIGTLALAPRIGDILAKRPRLLEVLLSAAQATPKPVPDPSHDFETAINAARRWQGEQAFLIGHRLLHSQLSGKDAAQEWSSLAEACVTLTAQVAEAETVHRFGKPPGRWTIAALGKLGGRELTAGSDLDLLVIYDADGSGDAQTWFTRFTQRLITAISAETGEGRLYEVDMRLRPSGRAGPVATSVVAFETYHQTQAWTWERMALTRLRPVAGDEGLAKRVSDIAKDAILHGGDRSTEAADILDMRQRLAREKPAQGVWDLKMREGGLVDLEFLIQKALLQMDDVAGLRTDLSGAISAIGKAGLYAPGEIEVLVAAWALLQPLQQVQRLSLGADAPQTAFSKGLAQRLAQAGKEKNFKELECRLEQVCQALADLRLQKIGPLATEA
ncbi:MAG: bifunctional [glutamine synthetase] adenylyltransferase/[glutamine synthetase]-adenylyl-L-tyrosine phosphorylase [Henriciella sp.]|nr:bifunctional [glutamine synthetase] adenylyltransferase/[glutamine synthetase]-adenylyl-L-tyrosine phosphorylase [Henriciella sp.]